MISDCDNISFLHPETVGDVVDELLSNDFINKDALRKLKDDNQKLINPNLLMDLRHRKVKPFNSIDTNGIITVSEKRKSEESILNTKPKVKDLKRIDKEIAKTKRNLEVFQEQLNKKKEIFKNKILKLEENMKEGSHSPVTASLLDEDESKHYFNLHLDRLENSNVSNTSRRKEKIWTPFEPQTPAIIDVITTLKVVDDECSAITFDEEEMFFLKMCNDNEVLSDGVDGGRYLDHCSLERSTKPPNNTPLPEVHRKSHDNKAKEEIIKMQKIAIKAINVWKSYVKRKRIERLLQEKESEFKTNLMKKYFTLWRRHTKTSKSDGDKNISKGTTTKMNHHYSNTKSKMLKEIVKHNKNESFHIHTQTIDSSLIVVSTFVGCSVEQKIKTITSDERQLEKITDGKNHIKTNIKEANVNETRLQVKMINPEDVGLKQKASKAETNSNCSRIMDLENECITKRSTKIISETISHRYEAQQKIILQQQAVIEEQKILIADLKAKILETKSELGLKTAEYQLKNVAATVNNRFQPVVRMVKADSNNFPRESKNESNLKNVDNSEKLTKRLLERQEYCKQLAERTRIRKVLIEEEQAKIKLEEQERLKRIKEEEKLQTKRKQKIAEENMQKALETKERINQLNEVAKTHYKRKLCRKYFNAFRKLLVMMQHKAEDCKLYYEQKLLKEIFKLWQLEVNEYKMLKNNLADRHFKTRLLNHSWDCWKLIHKEYKIKVQVSEDMYALKLQVRMIRRWIAFTSEQYHRASCMMELAQRLHRRHLLRNTFRHWRDLPRVMFIVNKKEQQRRAWRQAVQEVVPDFSPTFAEDINLD